MCKVSRSPFLTNGNLDPHKLEFCFIFVFILIGTHLDSLFQEVFQLRCADFLNALFPLLRNTRQRLPATQRPNRYSCSSLKFLLKQCADKSRPHAHAEGFCMSGINAVFYHYLIYLQISRI